MPFENPSPLLYDTNFNRGITDAIAEPQDSSPAPPNEGVETTTTRIQEAEEIGPVMGPLRPPRTPSPAPHTPYSPNPELSPYSLNRATIRSLTFPKSIPDIPDSPPGDEPAEVAAKFDHFRQLKRQGIHFNEKLLRSSALRNPNLLEKLTEFVGVSGADQYTSNLPKEIWDPTGFPEYAFAGRLAKSQQEVLEKRQAEERSKIDFVSAAPPTGVSITMPPVSQDRKAAGSAAERVMAGLSRERKPNTLLVDPSKRREERRGDGNRDERDKDRTRDRRKNDDQYRKRRRSRTRSRSRSKERETGRYRDYEPRR